MPPKSRKPAVPQTKTLILDNGAYTLKAGLLPPSSTPPSYADCAVIPNCIARSTRDKRSYVGSELDDCRDFGELAFRRPVERGFVVGWEAQKGVWEREVLGRCEPTETNLVLLEKPNCPRELQRNCDEIVFEQFGFAGYWRGVGPATNAFHNPDGVAECMLVIDTSYSDTTILPLYNGKVLQSAVRRITVGGKLLTNYLKELASLRHYNMMEETYLLNEIKEAVSFVTPSSQQFGVDLARTWKGRLGDKRALDTSIVVDYVLPDYEKAIHGHARPHDPVSSRARKGLQALQGPREDVLPLGNERFAVPELLFNPSDIGIQEEGIPGAVMQALSMLPEALRVGLLANVLVVGGNSLIPGFMERLEAELRARVPAEYVLGVQRAEDPVRHTWLGAARFAGRSEGLGEVLVGKAEYEEKGMSVMLIGPPESWHTSPSPNTTKTSQTTPAHIAPSAPMRRIPRSTRALDSPLLLSTSARPPPCPPLRAFSTTPTPAFLVPAGKQDKKKHQQFVRRWQKRLLGDSEPIGAHVDPYDPTSPVRIAPAEQGEYEEVLDDANAAAPSYRPADVQRGLMHVGGEAWQRRKLEQDMAREYEKLTGRTYTPLTLDMAREVEEWTGSLYTLRDEDFGVGERVQKVTGRPYTGFNYGVYKKPKTAEQLHDRFAQAVAEVYTLRQAGLDLDLAQSKNRGVYKQPSWVKDIKLYRTESGELALAFPQYKSAEQFLSIMQSTPVWDLTPPVQEEEELVVEEGEPVVEAAQPEMDPDTPAFKKAALVKQDPDKKPFDFMSNRPVPRAKPVETPVETPVVEEVVATVVDASEQPPTVVSVSATSPIANASQHADLEARAQRLADDMSAMQKTVRPRKTSPVPDVEEVKWRHAEIADDALKFALFKRIHQLTSLTISDVHLSSTHTLGDLYAHLCTAAKPQPTSLFSALHIEGQKRRERAKSTSTSPLSKPTRPTKPDLGALLTMGNVALHRTRPTAADKRKSYGLDKVVDYAFWERGLDRRARDGEGVVGKSDRRVVEGTRAVPEFGRVHAHYCTISLIFGVCLCCWEEWE
ncbi:actin-domain-containing protein [Dothidotthia symphoricarpi CBS 119687]|uniref:Actin-like protein ARP6 n=1 Tax=Dothidotthia symphoricarpi CBS 119687 TaxID=1392245 RepID=A0A6A6AQ22_9PLEO|nr:actin-domain-containing protein [Dothidotthia symphoricarpi CBS 119687]KAF2133636.1 actin-domain-containing protein [Dothidotthia symphoricarpi CBS 119687]